MASIEFLGCGEACDPDEPNTAFLLAATGTLLLFDCGFTVPHRLAAAMAADPDRLDGVWISHFHGDHFFGIPLLFLLLADLGRARPLVLAGPAGLGGRVDSLLRMAYGSLADGCGFPWRAVEVAPGESAEIAGARLTAAASGHGAGALAVRCDAAGAAVFYSGDGPPDPAAEDAARGADLAVMECFETDGFVQGHNRFAGALGFIGRVAPARAALVHVRRRARTELARMAAAEDPAGGRLFVPAGGDRIDL